MNGNSTIGIINTGSHNTVTPSEIVSLAKPDEVADGSDNSSQANLTRYLFEQFIKGSENVPI